MAPANYQTNFTQSAHELIQQAKWFWRNPTCDYQVYQSKPGETVLIRSFGEHWCVIFCPDECLKHAENQDWLAHHWKAAEKIYLMIRSEVERLTLLEQDAGPNGGALCAIEHLKKPLSVQATKNRNGLILHENRWRTTAF